MVKQTMVLLGAMLLLATTNSCASAVAERKQNNPGVKSEPTEMASSDTAGDNPYETVNLGAHMGDIDGTFVFLDVQRNVELVHNRARAETRFSPYSTYKIPHTLIALETGVASGPEQSIQWDEALYPKEPWWDTMLRPNEMFWDRDHTLTSAFQQSCVWYFKETAKKIGASRMQSYLDRFAYGNQNLSSGIDSFWLGGSLEISAMEQVQFLKRFLHNDLRLKPSTVGNATKVFEKARTDTGRFYAKTGGGANIGWYVGFIEDGGHQYIFALNMAGTFEETFHQRVDVTMGILADLDVWAP